MDIYGILAHPAFHSLSPAMHNAGFKALNINAKYEYFDILPENLKDFMHKVRKEEIKGLSVSSPHKENVMKFLDKIDETAEKIGAVNTIINKSDYLYGTNVDWIGVRDSIQEHIEIKGQKAIVLGAGGAARAAVYALKKCNAKEIVVLNRTVEHAKALSEEFGTLYGSLNDFDKYNPKIVIQATSAGMNNPKGVELIPKSKLKNSMLIMEMIYRPLMTKILRDAKEIEATIITGDKMLLNQGFAAFELWTGRKAPKEEMRKAVMEHLST
jgi:shikimate dehydrogenase